MAKQPGDKQKVKIQNIQVKIKSQSANYHHPSFSFDEMNVPPLSIAWFSRLWFISNVWRLGSQVWFQNARAKFRRNLLRQENTGVDKASDGSTLPGGTPSGPASEISNASMSPSSTPTTLTDLTNPTMPTITSVLTSVPGSLDVHECRSPSQSTLTSLFWCSDCSAPSSASSIRGAT